MPNCKQCNGVLEAKPGKEAPAYCSEACRKKYARQHRTSATPDAAVKPTPDTAKRGVDIKCFADLPPDVQADIERYSRVCTVEGVQYSREQDRQARTARAIRYQHVFPQRYHQQGNSHVVQAPLPMGQYNRVSKPGDGDYDGPQGPLRRNGKMPVSPRATAPGR